MIARLALLVVAVVIAAVLLFGTARYLGMPSATDCGQRNPAGHLRGCPDATEGD